MFTVSNQNNVYSILNNWCMCINISCGRRRCAVSLRKPSIQNVVLEAEHGVVDSLLI